MKRIIIFLLWVVSNYVGYANNMTFSITDEGIQINYDLPDIEIKGHPNYPGASKFLLESFGVLEADGYPSLLQKTESFIVPDGKKIGEITYTATVDTIKCLCCPSEPVHFDSMEPTMGVIIVRRL